MDVFFRFNKLKIFGMLQSVAEVRIAKLAKKKNNKKEDQWGKNCN